MCIYGAGGYSRGAACNIIWTMRFSVRSATHRIRPHVSDTLYDSDGASLCVVAIGLLTLGQPETSLETRQDKCPLCVPRCSRGRTKGALSTVGSSMCLCDRPRVCRRMQPKCGESRPCQRVAHVLSSVIHSFIKASQHVIHEHGGRSGG